MITLPQILERTRQRIAAARGAGPLAARFTPRSFAGALRARSSRFAVIAEIKRASPSRGPIRPELVVAELARAFEGAGAAALSILTEPDFFGGRLEDLQEARTATGIPLLRKDFVLDELQLDEALHHGADAVLLLASALDDGALERLMRAAQDRALDVLVEVHDADEIARVLPLGPRLVGVNNRSLKTMQVDPTHGLGLVSLLPRSALRVAESGLKTASDLVAAQRAGYEAFLIGESLLTQREPGPALESLLREARAWSG